MFGEFITKMFIKMSKITNCLLVWMFLVMPKLLTKEKKRKPFNL